MAIQDVTESIQQIQEPVYKRSVAVKEADVESVLSDPKAGIVESDYKHKQTFTGWTLFWLAYQATGVIYGDIGTSPLYVFSSTFSDEPSYDDLLGALSIIIWSLTLIVTVKYVFIVLRADDEGEGGTFALYTLLSRYTNIMRRDPRVNQLIKFERYDTDDLYKPNRGIRAWLEKSKTAHAILSVLAVFGVSLIMADGILTPAQSVLGAVQGLNVVNPSISTGTIIGASCAIIIALYLVQPFGVHRLSSTFAPVVIIWLLFNAASGIYNLAVYDYSVLKAFSPYFAGAWFVRNGTTGWINLGGLLLAFTGTEALFADLGAFSRRAVQISWLALAFPCLLLAYIGQAACIASNQGVYSNPFFNSVPPGTFYFSLVIAILAAIVASQALITSTFQLLSQVINASYFPHIQTIHTSSSFHGQVYIPIANWLMMVGTVIVTAVYNNTTSLGNAYGVCVILVTFITTNMVSLVAVLVWKIHPAVVFLVWLPLVTLDGLYATAALVKVPNGAWFTLLLAVILAAFFTLWRYGKESQWSSESQGQRELSDVVQENFTPVEGFAIFFDKTGSFVPQCYEQWLQKFRAQPEIVVLMHLRSLSVPHVTAEDRFAVAKTSIPNVYRLVVRYGYGDHIITPDLSNMVYGEIRKAITNSDRLEQLDKAYRSQTLFLLGKEKLRIGKSSILRRLALGLFLWIRENCRNRIEKLNVPIDRLIEIGFVKEL